MKKLAALGGVAGLVLVAALGRGQAGAPADPMADISDVYAWMTGANLNLVMDVSQGADANRSFGPGVAYVFHVTSKAGLGVGVSAGVETQVVCRFDSASRVQCWVSDAAGVKDYVDGDPSGTAGVASRRGRVRVFAGRRSDPAFFNAQGYAGAVALFAAQTPGTSDKASCPAWLTTDSANQVIDKLRTGPDAFAASNVMALVVQVDKVLVNAGDNSVVGVWGATHAL